MGGEGELQPRDRPLTPSRGRARRARLLAGLAEELRGSRGYAATHPHPAGMIGRMMCEGWAASW